MFQLNATHKVVKDYFAEVDRLTLLGAVHEGAVAPAFAIAGAGMLDLDVPRAEKRLLVIVETDGCFVDGVEAVAGVAVGRRTLRVEDY